MCSASADHVEEPDARSSETEETAWDSRVIMVEEHLLGALLANCANLPPTPRRHSAGKTSLGRGGSCSPSGCDGRADGGGCEPISAAEGADAMEVQGAQGDDHSVLSPDTSAVGGKAPVSTVTRSRELPHAVHVVASMVNRVLQVNTYLLYAIVRNGAMIYVSHFGVNNSD